jgi:hypothetical protein
MVLDIALLLGFAMNGLHYFDRPQCVFLSLMKRHAPGPGG